MPSVSTPAPTTGPVASMPSCKRVYNVVVADHILKLEATRTSFLPAR